MHNTNSQIQNWLKGYETELHHNTHTHQRAETGEAPNMVQP
jgi:hypothetical protein